MESRLLGIPLIIWFLLIGLVVLVDVPAFMIYNSTSDHLDRIEYRMRTSSVSITPTVTPIASPSATVSPTTPMQYKKVYLSPAVTTAPTR